MKLLLVRSDLGAHTPPSLTLPWPESSAASIGSQVGASFFKLHFDGSGLMLTCLKARIRAPTSLYSGQGQRRAQRLHTVITDENKDRCHFISFS